MPRWASHLGCIESCLNCLDISTSLAWLYGATGHAFVINVHEEVCPGGPTAWNTRLIIQLGQNIGCTADAVFGTRLDADFAETRTKAWDHARNALDRRPPCYGWELDMPEYCVVLGYDDSGYYFSGPGSDSVGGPCPWSDLGNTEIGVVEMYSVAPEQASDVAQTVRVAMVFALWHATGPAEWIFPEYAAGLAAYDNWTNALEDGTSGGLGAAYNAAVLSECRGFACLFLQEAKERFHAKAGAWFDETIARYEMVHQNLRAVAESFPFHGPHHHHIQDPGRVCTALGALRAAREAEAAGLKALEGVVRSIWTSEESDPLGRIALAQDGSMSLRRSGPVWTDLAWLTLRGCGVGF